MCEDKLEIGIVSVMIAFLYTCQRYSLMTVTEPFPSGNPKLPLSMLLPDLGWLFEKEDSSATNVGNCRRRCANQIRGCCSKRKVGGGRIRSHHKSSNRQENIASAGTDGLVHDSSIREVRRTRIDMVRG